MPDLYEMAILRETPKLSFQVIAGNKVGICSMFKSNGEVEKSPKSAYPPSIGVFFKNGYLEKVATG